MVEERRRYIIAVSAGGDEARRGTVLAESDIDGDESDDDDDDDDNRDKASDVATHYLGIFIAKSRVFWCSLENVLCTVLQMNVLPK